MDWIFHVLLKEKAQQSFVGARGGSFIIHEVIGGLDYLRQADQCLCQIEQLAPWKIHVQDRHHEQWSQTSRKYPKCFEQIHLRYVDWTKSEHHKHENKHSTSSRFMTTPFSHPQAAWRQQLQSTTGVRWDFDLWSISHSWLHDFMTDICILVST